MESMYIFYDKSSKILTLFDVLASSGNDFDLDDNVKFIDAANKRIKNIL